MSVFTQIKQLSKDSLFYGMGSALQKFIGFFLFPIYTRVLSQADFGAQDLVFTASTILTYFLVLGLDSATARHYYDADTEAEKKEILSTWLWFELLLAIPVSILLIIFAAPICGVIFNDASLAPYFQIGVGTLPFSLVASITSMALRLTFQSRTFSIVAASGVLIQGLSAVLLVVMMDMGIAGVFLANLIGFVLRAAMGLIFTHKNFNLSNLTISKSWLSPMIAYGLPLVPASLSIWILNYSNRYFLARLATLADIGLLGVGSKINNILVFIISAFQIAWGPFAFSIINDQKLARHTYAKVLTYFLLVSLTATVGLSVFGREAILILATPDYEASATLVPWLGLGSVAWGVVYIVGIGTGIAKKSYHTTIGTVMAAAVNISLNFILIPRWGILGAVISTAIGHQVSLIYRFIVGQYYFKVHYEYAKVLPLIGSAIIVIILGTSIDQAFPAWDQNILIYKIPICLLFAISIFLFRIVGREEIDLVQKFIKTKFASSS
jgi:O-antigen/teichoic acid export membrane protein